MSTSVNNMIAWNNELLEPVIITFNRAKNLAATLNAFYNAGLSSMRLHVLNNASTDDTALVVKAMQSKWKNLIYHENAFNIGGNANILRSVEFSDSTYHWAIGDDDEWLLKPELLAELMQVMQKGDANVIRLGWLVSSASRAKTLTGLQLAKSENLFFASVSMISATIVKRDIVTHYLPLAYQNIADSYPQLVPMICGTEDTLLNVYTLSQNLMIHTPSTTPGYFSGDLEWYAGWFRTSRFLKNVALKKSFINEVTLYMCRDKPGSIRQFASLVKVLLYYKSFNLSQTSYLFSMFAYGQGWRLRIALLIVVNAIFPVKFLSFLRKLYLPKKIINVDRARL
ncbi:MAG: glycosyltransferase [Gammaproteobacteria bacterium]|nr:glycosyltransferase [Gammaproteobacteria bacterium]